MIKNIPLCFFLISAVSFAYGQAGEYEAFKGTQIIADRQNSEWAMGQEYVVMISIDGFRYDYAEEFGARNILEFAEKGSFSRAMLPSFPSKTFPNHYTLVTGLLPGNHGLVGNDFYSRSRDAWYQIYDKEAVRDGSWYGGIPLWVLAEQQGMLSASFFWVGSEAEIRGTKPTYLYAYDGRVPNEYRLHQVADWLRLPQERRPHFITAYFSMVDDAGHRYGPDHNKTREAVLKVDSLIGDFMDALEQIDLPVNVVLVSDHGMSAISHGIVLPEAVPLEDAKVSYGFPPMIYQPDPVKQKLLYDQLLAVDHLEVYTKETVPRYLSFVNEDRVGDIILVTRPPYVVTNKPKPIYGGTHGFDPYTNSEMGAIFYAQGPRIKSGRVMPPFENIHVYPFIARVLNLPVTEPIDGNAEVLEAILK